MPGMTASRWRPSARSSSPPPIPSIADARAPSYPAVVNHVVYFGDGVSRKTVFRGFKITGARNFTTGSGEKSPIESDDLRKTAFFYTDGGGIKIYARSYPTIEQVEVYENYASPCGGGVSVEHLGTDPGLGALPQLHLPRQRHADDRRGLDLLHGSCGDASRTASSSATSPTWASTTSAC